MTTPDPVDFCEAFLRSEIDDNTGKEILESENMVAERLLARRLEMSPVYTELHRKLGPDKRAVRVFLGVILSATFWNPQAIAEARAGRVRLEKVNAKTADTANELALLLAEREELHNQSGFHSNTEYHPLNLIDRAGEAHYLYKSWVRKELQALRTYGLKYWPKIGDCITFLARDADVAEIEASDDITEAATRANRKGLADYLKAIFAAIETRREGVPSLIPLDFTLSDASFATIINCSLDLDADDGVGAEFVKRGGPRNPDLKRGPFCQRSTGNEHLRPLSRDECSSLTSRFRGPVVLRRCSRLSVRCPPPRDSASQERPYDSPAIRTANSSGWMSAVRPDCPGPCDRDPVRRECVL